MNEVRVSAYRVDVYADLLKLSIVVGKVSQLRRTYEGEVAGIEEEYALVPLEILVRDLVKALGLGICGYFELW